MHKSVVLDHPRENPGELDWSVLNELGEVAFYDSTLPEQAAERIGDADIVMLNKAVLSAETIAACPDLKFISVIATGYNTVDVAQCAKQGIKVSNVPSYGTEAIAQNAVALLMEITNRVAHHDAEVRKGRRNTDTDWCFWDYSVMELAGKTAGIIGLGRIGKISARILEAFGMKIIANNRHRDPAWLNENRSYGEVDEILEKADVVFLHCPLFDSTYHMINKETIARMKDGAILINNSRGALVDDEALAEALNSGKLAGAGLDAIEVEPIRMDNPLLKCPNCYITPHISWAALDCRLRLQQTSIDNVRAYIGGEQINTVC